MGYYKYVNKPLIFIPGILGSLGEDIIPGYGKFDFGIAEYIYRPFIEGLINMGYEEEKDLYICFYDWRKENRYSAKQYLLPIIEKAKERTGVENVDLLCHSMGGLLARAYIQSELYMYDIDKIIMIATPNAGSANAYYFWEGGQLPESTVGDNPFLNMLWKGFVWYLKASKKKDDMCILHSEFPSVKELLPSEEYGDYLIFKGASTFVPINSMKCKNTFLNILNRYKDLSHSYGVLTDLICGTDKKTNKYIQVSKSNTEEKWWDGQPYNNINTIFGDGTVTIESACNMCGRKHFLESDHTDILYDSLPIIRDILNRPISPYAIMTNMKNRISPLYSIIIKNAKNINIKLNNINMNICNGKGDIESEKILFKKLSENDYWIMIEEGNMEFVDIFIDYIENEKGTIVVYKKEFEGVKKILEKTSINSYKTVLYH
ncbi:esterase/lipase family protein [Clostridiisalibacter paucivorans]|uniref:esterase/lipase family protein n=1 Tax=Clostridiisalibacter paucivorans TaxID=408753 RepID=UPI000687E406|nr:hypothetical protein [Clostridiisalibacter paucivorans]